MGAPHPTATRIGPYVPEGAVGDRTRSACVHAICAEIEDTIRCATEDLDQWVAHDCAYPNVKLADVHDSFARLVELADVLKVLGQPSAHEQPDDD